MKENTNQIDKQLVLRGHVINFLIKNAGERSFRIFRNINKLVLRNPTGLDCSEEFIERDDNGKMRVLIYKSLSNEKKGPAILWLHGGGYATGVSTITGWLKQLIDLSGAVVVSPDYTLSIKKPYPAALHDAYSALLWLKENAGRLGADETMLMVGGQSAGGGLAAALALYARDKGEVKIVLQMPIYPMIDDRTISGKDANNLLWSRKNNAEAWRLYLGEFYGAPDVPFYAAPARAQDLSNMPPAIGFIGSLDLFLDETKAYFAGLKDAGVEAQLRIYGGCYHGFEAVHPKAEVSKKAVSEFISAFMDFIESGAR